MAPQMYWKKGNATATFFGKEIPVKNRVRNELTGERKTDKKSEVVHTEDKNGKTTTIAYMPRTFPVGTWKCIGINPHPDAVNDGYLYPFFIAFDTVLEVDVWSVDPDGSYGKPTGEKVKDYGYGVHYSTSDSTLGCLKVLNKTDLEWLVAQIKAAQAKGETVTFQVEA